MKFRYISLGSQYPLSLINIFLTQFLSQVQRRGRMVGRVHCVRISLLKRGQVLGVYWLYIYLS